MYVLLLFLRNKRLLRGRSLLQEKDYVAHTGDQAETEVCY